MSDFAFRSVRFLRFPALFFCCENSLMRTVSRKVLNEPLTYEQPLRTCPQPYGQSCFRLRCRCAPEQPLRLAVAAPFRGPSRQGGHGRRPAASGEFALPKTITPALPAVEAFADLDLPEGLLASLTAQGMRVPFPIQGATLPNTLGGRDVLGRGRTGSGKTLAFGLALLARTAGQRAEAGQPLALILVPTRELAQQVTDALLPTPARSGCV